MNNIKRINGIYHCRYCDVLTENKNRKCNVCKDLIKCKRCKKKLNKRYFEKGKFVCLVCKQEEIEKKNKIKIDNCSFELICDKCKNKQIVIRRYKNKPKGYLCEKCLKEKNNIPGKFTKCAFCKKELELISSAHIKKCSNDKINYEEYINKYGKFDGEYSIYSEKYRNRIKKTNKERDKNYKKKISRKTKKWWNENKEVMSNKLKIAQNTKEAKENHRNGYLNYYKNITDEQKKQRSESAKRSWENDNTRRKRIESMNKPESIEARIKGGRKAGFLAQQNSPKITKIALKVANKLTDLKVNHKLEYPFRFYHLDIALIEFKIAIETDGDYWHGNPKFHKNLTHRQKKRQNDDKRRNTFLINRGWKVLRFWEHDINNNFEECLNTILKAIGERKCMTEVL